MSRIGARLALVLLLISTACERKPTINFIQPWFKEEIDPPLIDIPHALKWGGEQHRDYLFVNEWKEVYRGPEWPGSVPLPGGEGVLMRRTAQLYRKGAAGFVQLAKDKCPSQFLYSVGCLESRAVACLLIKPPRSGEGCAGIQISTFDLEGRLISQLEASGSRAQSCLWDASDEDFNSRAIAGFDTGDHPVIAVRLAGSKSDYSLIKLAPPGNTEIATLQRQTPPQIWSWPYDLQPFLVKYHLTALQCQ